MSLIRIYAGGKMKSSPLHASAQEYLKRLHLWRVECLEVQDFKSIKPLKQEAWVALEAGGKNLSSPEFLHLLFSFFNQHKTPAFLIGPSTGLPPSVPAQAACCLSFGKLTWPHLLARLLLLEQIYRAQQAFLHHPYSFV